MFYKIVHMVRLRGLIFFALLALTNPLAAASNLYENLSITNTDKELIAELLRTMAEDNVVKLLFKQNRLREIGRLIQPVHPLRFLGTVFSDRRLMRYMAEIRQSKFKWEEFIKGFVERMRYEAKLDNLLPYASGFAQMVNRDPVWITKYIETRDFEGLVLFLLS